MKEKRKEGSIDIKVNDSTSTLNIYKRKLCCMRIKERESNKKIVRV